MAHTHPHSPLARIWGLLAVGLALAACSSGTPKAQREYEVPDKLCGMPVDRDALEAFLPPGKELAIHKKYVPIYSGMLCYVLVDGYQIAHTEHEWRDADKSIGLYADMPGFTLDHWTDDGRFAYSGFLAFGKTEKCRRTERDNKYAMFTKFFVDGSKHRDASAMKDLITHFTDAVEQSSFCSPGTSQTKREYAVPDELCGTPIDHDALNKFLPPGKELDTDEQEHSDGKTWLNKKCSVLVDGIPIVSTTRKWGPRDESTSQFAYTSPKPGHRADSGRFLYSDYLAFGKTKNCTRIIKNDAYAMFTSIDAYDSKHRDANAMKNLITHFTDAVEKSSDCH